MNRKITLLILTSLLLGSLGCNIVDEPIEFTLPIAPRTTPQSSNTDSIEGRFTDPGADKSGAVERALIWSQKYDELSVKVEKLMERNSSLVEENIATKHKLSQLQIEYEQTKKELDEANTFLQEMHLELTRWKSDVLGFRNEIRKAQATQLNALSRILRMLGAEMVDSAQIEPGQEME
ncbi:MAG: hypothetical protein KAJ07_13215 [Planctomycetes bacterium]|nr:hypothetical protein [Planctomycetota bacterium]